MEEAVNALVRHTTIAAILGVAAATPAGAQAAADSLGWHFVGNLGFVQASGNTRLTTVNVGDKLTYRPGAHWLLTQTAAMIYGKTSGVESANQVQAGVRADYGISARLSAFGVVAYERNPFAGISRRLEELVGLSAKLVSSPKHELRLDAGVGNNQQLTGGVTNSFFVARLSPTYRYNLSSKAYVEEIVELLENLQATGDLRTTSQTSLVAPLTGSISIRLSYLMRYDAEPALQAAPNAYFKKLDTVFTTGIQLTL